MKQPPDTAWRLMPKTKQVNSHKFIVVRIFKYLGSSSEDSEIIMAAVVKIKSLWKDKNICLKLKIKMLRELSLSIFL